MDTQVARRDAQRPGRTSSSWHLQPSIPSCGKVCSFWLAGNCTRNPCRFLHSETVPPFSYTDPVSHSAPKQSHNSRGQYKNVPQNKRADDEPSRRHNKQHCSIMKEAFEGYNQSQRDTNACHCSSSASIGNEGTRKAQYKICKYWVSGNCVHGEKCKYLHSWSYGSGLSMLTQLQGHRKVVTGITLPSGSDKLFSGSKDGTVRVWNCLTGECIRTFELGSPIGSLISEGAWMFVGIENVIKAWNIQTNVELTLSAPGGQVYAMCTANEMLLAGVHDGSILAWNFNSGTNSFEAITSLKGHAGAVISLVFGAGRLYSGSMDNTMRVWDLENRQCIHTLNQHSEVVMSMVCYDQYLISCSLDQTLKIWATTEARDLEVVYTHNEENGILSLRGMPDSEGKPILLCSCNDNSVHLYELPSFTERGRVFARQEVRTIEIGPGGLFFTGDATGTVSVLRLSGDSECIL